MKTFIWSLVFLVSNSYAGTITMKGISNIGQAPDYLELPLSVESKCFDSAEASNAAVEKLAEEFSDIMKKHISLVNGDQLVVTAGRSARRRETTSVYNPITQRNEPKVLCEKGWSSSRHLIARFADLAAFEVLNPELLELIDLREQAQSSGASFVTSTVGKPLPKLMPETKTIMEAQALKEALINASNKFKVVRDLCSLANASLQTLNEAAPVLRDYRDGGVPRNPLNFEQQYVHLAWDVVWSFDNTGGVCEEAVIQ